MHTDWLVAMYAGNQGYRYQANYNYNAFWKTKPDEATV